MVKPEYRTLSNHTVQCRRFTELSRRPEQDKHECYVTTYERVRAHCSSVLFIVDGHSVLISEWHKMKIGCGSRSSQSEYPGISLIHIHIEYPIPKGYLLNIDI